MMTFVAVISVDIIVQFGNCDLGEMTQHYTIPELEFIGWKVPTAPGLSAAITTQKLNHDEMRSGKFPSRTLKRMRM
jgi:hypothetical protein